MPPFFKQSLHSFTPQPASIDYFKLTDAHFKDGLGDNLSITINDIKVSADFLGNESLLGMLDLGATDTTLLNFQTGSGKTELLYKYVDSYKAMGGYTVVFCAPFKRLLQQIQQGLNSRGVSVYNFNDDSTEDDRTYLTAQVLLMTPEFLLGSGGSKFKLQAPNKEQKRVALWETLEEQEQKVVLIIDEIHEETDAYQSLNLPQLDLLSPIIHKVFIASATFTRESVEVAKVVSLLLTNQQIVIYQADRMLQNTRAKLHLHVCADPYSATNLDPLYGLSELLISISQNRRVHILTAHKSMADALMKPEKGAAAKAVRNLRPKINLLTSFEQGSFDPAKNTIGTTFMTGVNITGPEDVLVIILPGGSENQNYGTFTNGLVAIVQSLARLRKGGDVHIFMPPFEMYLETGNPKQNRRVEMLIRKIKSSFDSPPLPIETEENAFSQFKANFEALKRGYKPMLDKLGATTTELRQSYEEHVGTGHFYDFVLSGYNAYKMENAYSQGKAIVPILLNMALRDQFVTCSLKSVRVEHYTSSVKLGGAKEVEKNLMKLLGEQWKSFSEQPLFAVWEEGIQYLDTLDADGNRPTYTFGNERNNAQSGNIVELIGKSPAVLISLLTLCLRRCRLNVDTSRAQEVFKSLLENATPDTGVIGNRYYTAKVVIEECQQELRKSAVRIGNKLVVKEAIANHIPEQSWNKLERALKDLKDNDPFCARGKAEFPRCSAKLNLEAAAKGLIVDGDNIKLKRCSLTPHPFPPGIPYKQLE